MAVDKRLRNIVPVHKQFDYIFGHQSGWYEVNLYKILIRIYNSVSFGEYAICISF